MEPVEWHRIAEAQLRRMRGMTRFYHERFFADIRFTVVTLAALFVLGWWEVPESFVLVPVVALIGAIATSFDATYLVFARQYARRLERLLDPNREVLVGSDLEDVYLFPLDQRKVVTVALRGGFTWFGLATTFYSALGLAAGVFGLVLAVPVVADHGDSWLVAYLSILGILAASSLVVGLWWFVGGVGERRLRSVLDTIPDRR